jgi:hypothetical protein
LSARLRVTRNHSNSGRKVSSAADTGITTVKIGRGMRRGNRERMGREDRETGWEDTATVIMISRATKVANDTAIGTIAAGIARTEIGTTAATVTKIEPPSREDLH